jgi:transcriptional regulator with XRE-family HTH domain
MRFGPNIKRLRLERHLTQTQLAAKCGIAQPNLATIERKHTHPSALTVHKLAKALNVQIGIFFEEPKNPLRSHQMKSICKNLILGHAAPRGVDEKLWQDICVTFRPKARAANPAIPRPKLRLSANAAQQRLKLRLTREGLNQLVQTFNDVFAEKF